MSVSLRASCRVPLGARIDAGVKAGFAIPQMLRGTGALRVVVAARVDFVLNAGKAYAPVSPFLDAERDAANRSQGRVAGDGDEADGCDERSHGLRERNSFDASTIAGAASIFLEIRSQIFGSSGGEGLGLCRRLATVIQIILSIDEGFSLCFRSH